MSAAGWWARSARPSPAQKPKDGGLVLKPSLNGCDLDSVETVRARGPNWRFSDPSALTEVAWIAPGAP